MSAIKLSDGVVTRNDNNGVSVSDTVSNNGNTLTDGLENNEYNFDAATTSYKRDSGQEFKFLDSGLYEFYFFGNLMTPFSGTHNGSAQSGGSGSASGDPFITPIM